MLYPNNFIARDAIFNWLKYSYNVPDDYKVRSLVPLSVGLDSVALLAALLQNTNHEIHAHHVDIANPERRSGPENLAVASVLSYMRQHYRPFTYSTSKYEMMLGMPERVGPDVSLIMFMASRVNFSLGNVYDVIWTAHMKGAMFEYLEAAAIHAGCNTNARSKPLWALPFMNISKFNLYNAISPELASLTWSCRVPVYNANGVAAPCEKCHACGAMRAVRLQVSRLQPASAAPAT